MLRPIALALALLAAATPAAAHRRPCVDSEARCCAEGTIWDATTRTCVTPTS